MKVVCSWCRKEGKAEFVREKAPLDDARETHELRAAAVRDEQVERQAVVPRRPRHHPIHRRRGSRREPVERA